MLVLGQEAPIQKANGESYDEIKHENEHREPIARRLQFDDFGGTERNGISQ